MYRALGIIRPRRRHRHACACRHDVLHWEAHERGIYRVLQRIWQCTICKRV